MALIKCSNCNHEISDTLKKCIHCGAKMGESPTSFNQRMKHKKKLKKYLGIFLIVLLVGGYITFQIVNTHKTKNNNNQSANQENDSRSNDEDNSKNKENSTTNNENTENNENDVNTPPKTNNNTQKDNNTTTSKIIISASLNVNCIDGYELSNDKTICTKKTKVDVLIEYLCLKGFELKNDKCKSVDVTEPINGKCYGNDVLEDNSCVKYIEPYTSKYCPSGYEYEDTLDYMNNICTKKETIAPNKEYTCPSGYTLNGTNCEK